MATGRETRALLVLVLLLAASVLAYTHGEVAAATAVVARDWRQNEPGIMLVAGSALVGLGAALRRVRL